MHPININLIHDYIISKYIINYNDSSISMSICDSSNEKTILFRNVFSHNFCNEMPYSIIFDLEERSIDDFFSENRNLLVNNKSYAWPIMYNSLDELRKKIEKNNSRYFVLNSSYGLNGWILSEEVEVINN